MGRIRVEVSIVYFVKLELCQFTVFRVLHNSQEDFIFVRSVRKLLIHHLEGMMVDGGRKEEFSRDRVTLKSTNKQVRLCGSRGFTFTLLSQRSLGSQELYLKVRLIH